MYRLSTEFEQLQPLFRWAGSKRKLVPELMTHVPTLYSRYIEPFAGSGCLFFAIRPKSAVIGDSNQELIHAYTIIRRHPKLVARKAHSFGRTTTTYYRLRSMDPEKLEPVERAARFMYLNRHCFNGVYRINRQGKFNVPRGTRTGSLPSELAIIRSARLLKNTELRCGDYRICLNDVNRGDFVYLDPPYASRGRTAYGEYGYDCFSEEHLPELIKVLRNIDDAGATFLLSYCPHSVFNNLPKGWHKKRLRVRRHVAGFASFRKSVAEILVSNRPLKSKCEG